MPYCCNAFQTRTICSCECRREQWQAFASIMRACFFTPVHSLPLHASPAWHHLLELVFLCGGLSPLAPLRSVSWSSSPSSQCWALTAQHWQAEWSGVPLSVFGSCHWRAVEHQRIHLYQSGSRSFRGCPCVKHYLGGCWEHRDRLGKMWTGQTNIGLQWLCGLCAVCALTAFYKETEPSIWKRGK